MGESGSLKGTLPRSLAKACTAWLIGYSTMGVLVVGSSLVAGAPPQHDTFM